MTRGAALLAVVMLDAWQQPRAIDVRAQIRALADEGRLDDAEKRARDGGPALAASLGEVLVLRGRLSAADSAFRVALERDVTGRRTAEAALAELAFRRGDRGEAFRRADAVTRAYEQSAVRWSADDRVAAGRAYVLLGARNAPAVRQALAAFDAAVAADSTNVEARVRAGDLLLDKYNAPDAKISYDEVLRLAPEQARALVGLARVALFAGTPEAMTLVRRAVKANPSSVDAHVLLAHFQMDAEAFDSARVEARRALAVDSSSIPAWSMLGATAWVTGDSAELIRARTAVRRLNPHPADFYAELASVAANQRRYGDAERLAREALAVDSTSVRALGLVGANQLKAGRIEEGRATIEKAFAIDPFNLWHKNTLDLLDHLKTFKTIERGHFVIVAPPKEAGLLATYLVPLLEQAYDSLSARYHYTPSSTVRLEIYREHADFSVRTVGLAGLGALGVSFGPVLAMDAPSARTKGDFNWGSTAWHELAHTFTLGLSQYRAPRWLSEGLSVLEERHARSGWGANVTPEFLSAYASGKLRPVSQLNDGFVHPRFPAETILSYYDASLVCEMIEEQFGTSALVAMLEAYRDGLSTPAVFERVLELKPEGVDARFDVWLRTRFASALRSIAPATAAAENRGPFFDAISTGVALVAMKQPDSARAALMRAEAMFPEYAGSNAPAWYLAQMAKNRGDLKEALTEIVKVTTRNELAWEANVLEADVRERLGDSSGARAPLERLIWISPYDVAVHVHLAELASRAGDHVVALRERRAIVALDSPDPLEARYQLARELAATGDTNGARKELLGVLEQAPAFEKAQALLLDLKNRTPR